MDRVRHSCDLFPQSFLLKYMISSRLREFKDTVRLIIFALDIMTQNSTIITSVQGLPHDAFSLLPCSTAFGGVVVITGNSVIYIDQSSRRVGLQVNGWATRMSDTAYLPLSEDEMSRKLTLEGCRSIMVDDKTVFLVMRDGTIYPVELLADGKAVSKLSISPALAQTTIPTVVKRVHEDHFFIGSTVGPSILLKTAHVEQEVEEDQSTSRPAVVTEDVVMDPDDDGMLCPWLAPYFVLMWHL
jgi:cleavage and polyadenylation specificity factor subunit 1